MAKTCDVCGKKPVTGRTVSHAHNVNPRIFYPNLRSIKTTVAGRRTSMKVCMKCLKVMGK